MQRHYTFLIVIRIIKHSYLCSKTWFILEIRKNIWCNRKGHCSKNPKANFSKIFIGALFKSQMQLWHIIPQVDFFLLIRWKTLFIFRNIYYKWIYRKNLKWKDAKHQILAVFHLVYETGFGQLVTSLSNETENSLRYNYTVEGQSWVSLTYCLFYSFLTIIILIHEEKLGVCYHRIT